jgi:hypothetical protein
MPRHQFPNSASNAAIASSEVLWVGPFKVFISPVLARVQSFTQSPDEILEGLFFCPSESCLPIGSAIGTFYTHIGNREEASGAFFENLDLVFGPWNPRMSRISKTLTAREMLAAPCRLVALQSI